MKKKLLSKGVKAVFTPKDFKIEDILKNYIDNQRFHMSKKTLELAIDLLKKINTFDLSAYTPIRFDKKILAG